MKLHALFKPTNMMTWITLCLPMWSALSYAKSDSVNFDVKVTIVTKTCTVNGNDPINVEFGDMIINRIKEGIYKKDIPYTLDCGVISDTPGLKLQFLGNGVSFAEANTVLLQTSEADLGLQFYMNGSPFNVNEWQNFVYGASLPSLSVLAVASNTGGIDDGEFTATATFSVEYQ